MEADGSLLQLIGGLIVLLLIAAGVRALTNRVRLPFSVVLVFTGILLGIAARNAPGILRPLQRFELSAEIILFLFLPTLVYESSQGMDVRELRKNLGPILTLAVPGLLISTALIGAVAALFTPLSWPAALLLGAILSATDPVAVISILGRMGAPKRLFVLVEGESLFNDATSLVLSRILAGIITGGGITLATAGTGALDFLTVFAGGLAVGGLLGAAAGLILGRVRTESFVVITVTTVLAYLSFLVAEELFHVSGVMAVVAAGLSFSGWGWMKVTPSVRTYLEHFWQYAAFLANALIFLFVGLSVQPERVLEILPLLLWVIAGMLVSRAVIVYGITPLADAAGRWKSFRRGYKPVLFWGGLRGAVALAIVLSLPEFGRNELLESLVIGAVLFTLFVQGLTIEPLVKLLGLQRPSLPDRFILRQHLTEALQRALERIKSFSTGETFSRTIAEELHEEYQQEIEAGQQRLAEYREQAEEAGEQKRILYLQTLSRELSVYLELFNHGHLGEHAFRELKLDLSLQLDALRSKPELGKPEYGRFRLHALQRLLLPIAERTPLLAPLAERRRRSRLAINYEISWGHKEGSRQVLEKLDELAGQGTFPQELIAETRRQYEGWYNAACRQMDRAAEQFPEFVQSVQRRLGRRLALLTRKEYLAGQMEHGSLPAAYGERLTEELEEQLQSLRQEETARLEISPEELLRKVTFFRTMGAEEFRFIARKLLPRTVNEKEVIIRQGGAGKSLFLIARGVVRVIRREAGAEHDLGSLFAGDFFGEMALLHGETRTATVRAATPCYMYELRREALEETLEAYPHIRAALQEADRRRKGEQG
jgi:CPA1 family monovalent cation:H+ antiporter